MLHECSEVAKAFHQLQTARIASISYEEARLRLSFDVEANMRFVKDLGECHHYQEVIQVARVRAWEQTEAQRVTLCSLVKEAASKETQPRAD